MISAQQEQILFAVFIMLLVGFWATVFLVVLKKRKFTGEPTPKLLSELRTREGVQAFLTLNNIEGDANIREGLIHPVSRQHPSTARATFARILRNEYSTAARHVGIDVVDARPLLHRGNGYEMVTGICMSDLIEIAELLDRMQ